MKKTVIIRTAAALLAAVLLYPGRALAISAGKAILMDGQTGRILFEKQANDCSLIASTTKIMTALIVAQQCNVLDIVSVPKEAVGIEGSSMYLQEGERLTVQELLYGLMLSSGNDAAVALAMYCSGTVEAFVEVMNAKARQLGLMHTHFANPHGLDAPGHYSTATDLALLASYAMTDPIFAQTVSTKSVRVGERYLTNHNKLLWQVDGADGVKTGYTKAAGRILVSSAVRCGRRLICVTIDDRNDWLDHKTLYDGGFANFHQQQLVELGQTMGYVTVFGGTEDCVEVLAAEDFTFALAPGEQISFRLSIGEFVYAPVVEGANAGFAYVCVDGKAVGKVALVYDKTIEMIPQQKKNFWHKIFGGKT